MQGRRKFSDFAKEEATLTGEKLQIAQVIGKLIYVKAYRLGSSKAVPGKQCLRLQFELDGSEYVTFTNSEVLIRQIEKYQENLPFETTIVKITKYYTFS